MALTSVDLDSQLIEQARAVTGEKSNRALLTLALRRLIAAYAIRNDATVLTADPDFDHIAQVSDLQHEDVAPE